MKRIRTILFMLGFAAVMLLPLLLQNVGSDFSLTGVSQSAALPEFTAKGVLDGTFQDGVNSYYSEHLPGRDLMVRLRNQAVYSLFGKSPNKNTIIGKDQVLFEAEYVMKYEKYYPPVTKEFTEDLCRKLSAIQERLLERGKELYIFITPTKVRYYEEYVPDRYILANRFPDSPGNYEMFTETLKDYDLKVYDSIPYVDEWAKSADFPLYYKTGTHWSWIISTKVAAGLLRFLDENSRFSFPEADTDYYPVSQPVYPDADIFNTMNLLTPPYDTYYQADLLCGPQEEEKPNLFCRGGSFMGQTIAPLISSGCFQEDTYIENTMVARSRFSQTGNFSDYAEIDLKKEIDQADILIFEVNEAHIPVMSFSLIDYLTEHPELLAE